MRRRGLAAAAVLLGAAVAVRAAAPAAVLLLAAAAPPPAPAYADGAPPGFSGGFGEQTCHACHFHEGVNAPPGRVTLAGVPDAFRPGERYELTVTLTRPGMAAGGFQLTARRDVGGAQAGTLYPGPDDKDRVKVDRPGEVEYAAHRRAGARPVVKDALHWSVVWTAPPDGGPVVFHVAANAADNDETVSGDFVYTTAATTLTEAVTASKMSVLNPHNGAGMDDTTLNRRRMLRSLGLATLTAAAVPASSAAKPRVQELKRTYHTYGTIADMTRDSTLADGAFVRVMGYHAAGDGGGAEYVVRKDPPVHPEGTIPLANSLYAGLINVASVNYRMFGTISDQKNDDGVQIKSAHIYANRINVPVINRTGEFWIKGTDAIPVLTSIEWGGTVFHVDENAGARANLFVVQSREAPVRIEFDAATKARVIAQVKPGVTIIPELAPYRNSFVLMTDTNDRIGSRGGARYGGTATRPKEEFFFVEEHGRILGDIAWEFTDYTSLVAHPGNSSYLIIDGGTFYMSGDAPRTSRYVNLGFSIRRSRTVIRNQWVGLEKGRADVSMSPKSGFYSFSSVYDVLLENVRLIPWEKNREGTDRDVPEGTYGIGGNRVLNGTFRNVTAEGSPVHWGVFGTNLFKNFRVEQCTLNRIDVHFHAWNLYISDCRIGSNGITITGGGDLFVDNTTCIATSFIAFRRDYGAKWDGDIRIRNCRHALQTTGATGLLTFQADDFDYRYPIGYGRTVKVDGMVVDFRAVPASTSPSWLMRTSAFSMIKEGARVFFPEHLEFRNIVVQGRAQGMRLLQIPDPQRFRLSRAGGYDGVQLTANCRMIVEDVQLETMPAEAPRSDQVHLLMKSAANLKYLDEYALYPEIRVTRCHGISAHFGGSAADVVFDQCRIARLTGSDTDRMPGALTFRDCKFEAAVQGSDQPFYLLGTELGTSFVNCIVYAPKVDNVPRPDLADRLGFLVLNTSVSYNHVNTRLGHDILNYCRSRGVTLAPAFIGMLKSHHELEGPGA